LIRRLAALICLVALTVAGCGDSTVTVDVFAASSLTDVFTELEQRFEADNPGVDIRLNLAGSDTLRRQINDGADAHVFAPASIDLFDGLSLDGRAVEPIPYASNQLEIITERDRGLASRVRAGDLAGLVVARCSPGVPCGDAADRLIESLGLDLSDATVTSEQNVRAVLSKVELGEADVGFVYRSDVNVLSDDVMALDVEADSTKVTLAIGVLTSAGDTAGNAAAAFVAFVISEADGPVFFGFDPAP